MSWNSERQVGRPDCDQVAAAPEIALELFEIEAVIRYRNHPR